MNQTRFRLWSLVASIAAATAFGSLLAWISGMPIWGGIAIIAMALVVNGIAATVEDNSPGGFNNPTRNAK
jgi:hypothetical protein